MSLIAQQIANLLNGVSQRPQEQRHSSQAESQKNGLSHLVRGLMKRPPLVYLGKLATVTTGWATAFVHSINRDEGERYHVAVANGDVLIYDALTQTPVTVLAPKGKAYLADGAGKGFRAATAGDTTVIVNRGVTAKRGATKTPALTYEALVYVRQADYGTVYQVTLNDVPVGIKTIAGSQAGTRENISTEKIATDLQTALKQEPLLNGQFTFTRYGSTLHIQPIQVKDFKLSVFDGLADKGLKAVKGAVQDFADLPRKAPNGFIVEVAGDPESPKDNYWVKFDDNGNPSQEGVWREAAAPGTIVDLDPLTMPHRLVRYGHIVQNVKHEGVLDAPPATVVDGAPATTTAPWTLTTPGDVAVPAGTVPALRDHGTGVKRVLGSIAKQLSGTYSIDMSLVEPGNDVTVTLYVNGVAKFSKVHPAGTGTVLPPPPPPPPPPTGGGGGPPTRRRLL